MMKGATEADMRKFFRDMEIEVLYRKILDARSELMDCYLYFLEAGTRTPDHLVKRGQKLRMIEARLRRRMGIWPRGLEDDGPPAAKRFADPSGPDDLRA